VFGGDVVHGRALNAATFEMPRIDEWHSSGYAVLL
jgi:hypothetical protein